MRDEADDPVGLDLRFQYPFSDRFEFRLPYDYQPESGAEDDLPVAPPTIELLDEAESPPTGSVIPELQGSLSNPLQFSNPSLQPGTPGSSSLFSRVIGILDSTQSTTGEAGPNDDAVNTAEDEDDGIENFQDAVTWITARVNDLRTIFGGGRFGSFDPEIVDDALETVEDNSETIGNYADWGEELRTYRRAMGEDVPEPDGYDTTLPIIDGIANFFLGLPGSNNNGPKCNEKKEYEDNRYHSYDCRWGTGCDGFCDPSYEEADEEKIKEVLESLDD